MSTYSVFLPLMPTRLEQVIPFAELVHRGAAARLWTGQLTTVDPLQAFSYAAGRGIRVPIGTAVMLMPLRDPFDAAMQLRAVALATGRPVVAGFAPGAPELQIATRGARYERPGLASAEYLRAVRHLLDGRTHRLDGRYFHVHVQQPRIGHPEIELGLGVLRPRMAHIAGHTADVAITWLTPPDYIRDVLAPALRDGAREAGRPAPRIAAVVHVALDSRDRKAVELARFAAAGHLSAVHYADMLNRAGVPVDPRNPSEGARQIVARQVFVNGPMEVVVTELRRYFEAGVDELVINLTAVNLVQSSNRTLAELNDILGALGV